MRENYNGVPMCFSVNQLAPSMANSTETDFKKKNITKTKQKCSQMIPPVAKDKEVGSNTEIENTSVDFNTLIYPEERISICDNGDEPEWESYFSSDISDYDLSGTDFSP